MSNTLCTCKYKQTTSEQSLRCVKLCVNKQVVVVEPWNSQSIAEYVCRHFWAGCGEALNLTERLTCAGAFGQVLSSLATMETISNSYIHRWNLRLVLYISGPGSLNPISGHGSLQNRWGICLNASGVFLFIELDVEMDKTMVQSIKSK